MIDLSNQHIIVTRPEAKGAELCALIESHGGQAINLPTIAFAPPNDPAALTQAITQLGNQDWLIFISPQAVYSSVVPIRSAWPEFPPEVKFAAVGEGTAKALQEAGYNVAVHPSNEWSSDALLQLPEFQTVTDKNIAIIRGEGGREVLEKTLIDRGAHVLNVIAYQRVLPKVDISPALHLLKQHRINAIVCTSYEGVKNLKILLGETGWSYIKNIPIIIPSERIKSLAHDLGFQTIWVARNASHQAIIDLLAKNAQKKESTMTDDQIVAVEQQPEPRRSSGGKLGLFFSTLAFIISLCAIGYGYFLSTKANLSLTQTVSDLKNTIGNNQKDIDGLQKSVTALQQATQTSQSLSAQQEQLMTEWRAAQKGNLDKWHVAEAQYLVKLANDHLQYTHDVSMAKILLDRADQTLKDLQDPSLLEIRKSLSADIANLQATPQVDPTELYLQLSTLNKQIDQLPLPVTPLKADSVPSTIDPNLPWWKVGLERTWQALRKIVIVRYNGSDALPLVLPEEKIFLYQNLHAQLESAMWAVLHHNAEVYQASLARALAWVQQYFIQDATETKTMLQKLQDLQKVNIQPAPVNLSNTLQLFDSYFAQSGQAKTV